MIRAAAEIAATVAELRSAGRLDEAVAAARGALAARPENAAALCETIASIEMQRGRWREAAEAWDQTLAALRAAEGASGSRAAARLGAWCALNGGTCRYLLGDAARATAGLVAAFALDRRLRRTAEFTLLASRLLRARDPRRAARLLERGATRYPNDHAIRFDLVVLLLDLDRASEARPHAERLALMKPEDGPTLDLAARAFERAGEAERAALLRGVTEALRVAGGGTAGS